jgi:hypothetical protein
MLSKGVSPAACHSEQEEQPIAALIALTQHLEGGRFLAYWQAADSCKDILGSVPGYYEAIRAYITGAISITCQKVSKTLLGEILHLEGAKLDQLVRHLHVSRQLYVDMTVEVFACVHYVGQGGLWRGACLRECGG